MPADGQAAAIIAALRLAPHPEGGWYRETFRSPAVDGGRSAVTAIHFLLESGQQSHWHRVDADEIWCWHAGSALALGVAPGGGGAAAWQVLGGDVLAGHAVQAVVRAGDWQAARADAGWALVSCIVAPSFDFSGFELAPAGWSPA
ncbi:MAG: cupin domain-containing protein [Sandarakinorhabdus sp.]|nr:cupin domain-containing protein [Sandarakinorhabdus sp.]